MLKIIIDKDLMKDLFQSLSYFVFIAGLLKLARIGLETTTFYYKLSVVFVFLILSMLALFYCWLHVLPQVVKKYYSDTKVPFVDPYYKIPESFGEYFSRKGLVLWTLLCFLSFYLGVQITSFGFN